MGYDMYWQKKDPEDVAAYEAAYGVFQAACRARDLHGRGSAEAELAQKKVDETYDALGRAERYYFRLNIWGMERCRQLMSEAGMLCTPERPTSEDWQSIPDYDEDDSDGGAAYREANDKLCREHRGECPGIPIHKFGSNDGWWVTPAEIRAALANAEGYAAPVEVEWWGDWIEYLKGAIDHDGFRVH